MMVWCGRLVGAGIRGGSAVEPRGEVESVWLYHIIHAILCRGSKSIRMGRRAQCLRGYILFLAPQSRQ